MGPRQPENIFVQKGGPLVKLGSAVRGLKSKQPVDEAVESCDPMPRLHVFSAQLNAWLWLQAQLKENSRAAHAFVTASEFLHPGSPLLAPTNESHDNRMVDFREVQFKKQSQRGHCWLPTFV